MRFRPFKRTPDILVDQHEAAMKALGKKTGETAFTGAKVILTDGEGNPLPTQRLESPPSNSGVSVVESVAPAPPEEASPVIDSPEQ